MAAASDGASTYRAAVVHEFREPLTIDQVPARELAPGQVRVKGRGIPPDMWCAYPTASTGWTRPR